MKFAVISYLIPPRFSGQAMMLYQLLKDVAPDKYCLISAQSGDAPEGESYSRRLPGKYFQLSRAGEITRGMRYGLPIIREGVNTTYAAYRRAREIAEIVRKEKCEAVLSCSSGSDVLDVPAGFYASRMAGVPFYLYLFDTYSHMWLNPQTKFIGRLLEPLIVKRAAGIIVTNESVRELLRERYGVDSEVIHNPCDIDAYKTELNQAPADGEVRIVYTGAVYEAHYDALRNLIAAIEELGRPEVKLHLYTAFSQDVLAENGISGPVIFHGHKSMFAMPELQRRADILFLPMAFNSPYPELIRISSPSKVGEFLAARRPVLVHAPPDAFVSKYFREHNCGLVVDRDDPKLLARQLGRLLDDPTLGSQLAENAWVRALVDFNLETAQRKFAEIMKLN